MMKSPFFSLLHCSTNSCGVQLPACNVEKLLSATSGELVTNSQ
uniref:Uncharacterized protein n=1 Tax=Setaria italica TaxID=4555 RepID=K4A3H4_SETIT